MIMSIEFDGGLQIFNCPVCGTTLLDYDNGESDECPHLMLGYTDNLSDEFCNVHKSMKKIANKMLAKYEEDDMEDANQLPAQMEKYADDPKNNCQIFSITTSGLSCGPCSSTDLVMIKMKGGKKKKGKKAKK